MFTLFSTASGSVVVLCEEIGVLPTDGLIPGFVLEDPPLAPEMLLRKLLSDSCASLEGWCDGLKSEKMWSEVMSVSLSTCAENPPVDCSWYW